MKSKLLRQLRACFTGCLEVTGRKGTYLDIPPCMQEYILVTNPTYLPLNPFLPIRMESRPVTYPGPCWRRCLMVTDVRGPRLAGHSESILPLRRCVSPPHPLHSLCDRRSSAELSACNLVQKNCRMRLQADKQMECPATKSSNQWHRFGHAAVSAATKWTHVLILMYLFLMFLFGSLQVICAG